MIKICFYKDKNKITVDGHALYGEKGQDIICSAVSILTYTLAENLKGISTAKIELDDGHASVSCFIGNGGLCENVIAKISQREAEINNIFNVICNGYKLLAENYPKHVSFETI